jgi:hypothetical protein
MESVLIKSLQGHKNSPHHESQRHGRTAAVTGIDNVANYSPAKQIVYSIQKRFTIRSAWKAQT